MNTSPKGKVVTFGEVMLRLTVPRVRRFPQANAYLADYGGSEANVAVSLATFGVPTEFVTRLPDNAVARACVDSLRTYGLGTEDIVYGGKRLGIYYLENGAAFRGSDVVYDRDDSAFTSLRPGMIDWERVFNGACWFHWSGIAAALSQSGADACQEALETARRMGLTISCDLNYRQKLWNYGRSAREVMLPLVQYSDVLFGAANEYAQILHVTAPSFQATDASCPLQLPAFKEFGESVQTCIPACKKIFLELRNTVTANHNLLAAILYSNSTLTHTRIYDIVDEVDRLGTGDAFVAGMIYGLLHYPDNDQRTLNFALAASTLKNTIPGDFNLSTVEEVESLLQGNTSGRIAR